LTTARNSLIPKKLAYYLPRIRGKVVLPENWVEKKKINTENLELITPAIILQEYKPTNVTVLKSRVKKVSLGILRV
jgi:hypothetical protein